MTTSQAEPRRLAEKTVTKWLEANAKRAGIPYTLVYVDPPFKVTEAGATATGDANPSAPLASNARGPGGPASPRGRGARPDYTPAAEQPQPKIYYRGGNATEEMLRQMNAGNGDAGGSGSARRPPPPSPISTRWPR